MATRTRQLAARILQDSEAGTGTLGDLLAAPDPETLPPAERALLHELVLGSLRSQGLLDYNLEPLLSRPLMSLDPVLRSALRLGAHQILSLRVPPHAAVSESVDLAQGSAGAGLVNAVLRRLLREGPRPLPDRAPDPLAWLTSAGSLPPWLAERWLNQLGPEGACARAESLLGAPPTVFRINPRRSDTPRQLREAGLDWRPLGLPGACELTAGRAAEATARGLIAVQAQGSQLVGLLAASGRRILDGCAAPGGKARLLADHVAERGGQVFAMERSSRRLRTLVELGRRWGAENLHPFAGDARHPPTLQTFDTVLLDAPCSGLGTLASNPDIRWGLTSRSLKRQARRQRQLLTSLGRVVTPGGRLVYSTCSLEPEENEEVVQAFLTDHPGFRPAPIPDWASAFRQGSFLRHLPERDGGDGFFAAALERDRSDP